MTVNYSQNAGGAAAVAKFVEGAGTITGQVLTIDSGFALGALPPSAR